jgi:hypothetical protein
MEGVLHKQDGVDSMEENRFRLGGWLAITAALVFPIMFVTGIVQSVIAGRTMGYTGPMIGPSDGLGLLFTGLTIYALIVFRRFLHLRYDYKGIDTLITFSIVWSVIMQVVGLVMEGMMMAVWPVSETVYIIISLSFIGIVMLCIGIVDLLIGVRLLQAKQEFGELLRVFAFLNLIAGILEMSIILSPLALLLVPVNLVVLGIILLRDKKDAEFV